MGEFWCIRQGGGGHPVHDEGSLRRKEERGVSRYSAVRRRSGQWPMWLVAFPNACQCEKVRVSIARLIGPPSKPLRRPGPVWRKWPSQNRCMHTTVSAPGPLELRSVSPHTWSIGEHRRPPQLTVFTLRQHTSTINKRLLPRATCKSRR